MRIPTLLVLAAIAASPVAAHAAIAQGADNDGKITFVYAPTTGNLTINLDGNSLGGVSLSGSSSFFKDGAFGTSPIYYQANATGTTLGFAALTGSIGDGTVLPGVFDTGLAASDLLAGLTVASVTNGPAAANLTFSGGTASTPEPTTLAVLGLGASVALRRRRTV